MNNKRMALVVLMAFSLSCNFATRAFTSIPTLTPLPTLTNTVTQTPIPPTPTFTPTRIPYSGYVPPECKNIEVATIPAATALATPVSYLQANPEIDKDLQLEVFNEMVKVVEEVYIYPDYNGKDWAGMVKEYRAQIEAGLDTEEFYAAMHEMISALGDEHSRLESPIEVIQSEESLSGINKYVGIGMMTLPMVEKGRVTITSIFPDSPAEHNGLKPHDSILAVDGMPVIKDGEVRTFLMRGPECTATVLTVQSPGGEPRDITFIRAQINSPETIEARLAPTSDGSRIGYIYIPTFFDETIPDQIRDALNEFGELDGLILDIRMNHGGSSSVAEPILSFFTSGVLGQFTTRTGSRPLQVKADPIQNSQTVPMVILVGVESVSYGEIFPGILKDIGRAKIVGQTTLGNVEALHGYEMPDGSLLWIAAATFTTVNSKVNFEETGIIPDVEAYADWDTFTFETDPGVAAAVTLLGH